MNILDLLHQDGIKTAHATKDEWDSECPWCGGSDRFSCFPKQHNTNNKYFGGRYVCRQCGQHGDAVSFLQKRRGMPFWQAVRFLGCDPGEPPVHCLSNFVPLWQPDSPKPPPPEAWQFRARGFVARCANQLASNQDVMTWLRADRGLDDQTILAAGLGWNVEDEYNDREGWGLLPETSNLTGKQKKLWIPRGLVIPWFDEAGNITRLRIRRDDPKDGARYMVATGSFMGPMVFWNEDQPAVVIVESELDGLLLHQQAGDLIGVVALGSAQAKPDINLHARLIHAKRILCALDYDPAGSKASKFFNRYAGFKRWPPVIGKDIADMFEACAPVRLWVKAGLV